MSLVFAPMYGGWRIHRSLFLGIHFFRPILGLLAQCLKLHIPNLPKSANLLWSFWRLESFPIGNCFSRRFGGKRINRIFNNSVRSSDYTFHVCFTFISYWFSLLLSRFRDNLNLLELIKLLWTFCFSFFYYCFFLKYNTGKRNILSLILLEASFIINVGILLFHLFFSFLFFPKGIRFAG